MACVNTYTRVWQTGTPWQPLWESTGGFKHPHVKIIIKALVGCGAGGWLRRLLARCLSLPIWKSICPELWLLSHRGEPVHCLLGRIGKHSTSVSGFPRLICKYKPQRRCLISKAAPLCTALWGCYKAGTLGKHQAGPRWAPIACSAWSLPCIQHFRQPGTKIWLRGILQSLFFLRHSSRRGHWALIRVSGLENVRRKRWTRRKFLRRSRRKWEM